MANIKSSKKRILTNAKAKQRNKPKKTAMRTLIKKLEIAIHDKKQKEAQELLPQAIRMIDKAKSAGIVHQNYASRQKSRLTKQVNTITQ